MKLFYMPGACSLAPHIALRETRRTFALEAVDYGTRRLRDGTDYRAINPKGSVPALLLDDGEVLTEVAVMLQYIAAQAPGCSLLPPDDGLRRVRCLEWLNYIATELHKSVSPLFRPATPDSFSKPGRDHLTARYELIENALLDQDYLSEDGYSVADIYLYSVTRWLPDLGIDTARWPSLAGFCARVARRSAVQAALAAEGLTGSPH